MTKPIFFAYPSQPDDLSGPIRSAVAILKANMTTCPFHPWELNEITGIPLISPILGNIDISEYVVADITTLNYNVVFEIGFAIGSNKHVLLVNNSSCAGDQKMYKEVGIFDTLGYHSYSNSTDLASYLENYSPLHPLKISARKDRKAPVYVVEAPKRNDAMIRMVSRLKKARWFYRSFQSSEDFRLSANEAIHHVSSSSGVLAPIVDEFDSENRAHNIRSAFIAGLSYGMGIPCLIIHDKSIDAPLDVRDYAKRYTHPEDIDDLVHEFALEITEYTQRSNRIIFKEEGLLQQINIGDPTAENEMSKLSKYYHPTDEFLRAVRGEANLVVGRKGSGKTALWIQLRDSKRDDKRNIVIDLKPEGYQLLKLKEDVLKYLSVGARQHLITLFWEYLILLEIAGKIIEKDKLKYKNDHTLTSMYEELVGLYELKDIDSEGDFSERLQRLSNRIAQQFRSELNITKVRPTNDQITSILYTHDFRKLVQKVSEYLMHKEETWILFDNLDKGWHTDGVDEVDLTIVRCLVDAGRKLERMMQRKKLEFHAITFVRNDVYTILMEGSSDYGKEMRVSLDWNDPDLLREMMRKRLCHQMNNAKDITFDAIWRQVCVSHYRGEESSSYMIERSLMRPRNLLKIFSHCRAYAANLGHEKIEAEDIAKGISAYSQDILVEADRELTDIFPKAKDIIYEFYEQKSSLDLQSLEHILSCSSLEKDELSRVIEFLMYFGFLGLQRGNDDPVYIENVNYNLKLMATKVKKWGAAARYIVNPAFWPALEISTSDQPSLV